MRMLALAGLLSLPLLTVTATSAQAQFPNPQMGCGGFCFSFLGRIHQHGPLFNYGPYEGYYPFTPYGPWTSDLRYNPPIPVHYGHNHALLHKLYAVVTLQNVWARLQPLQHRLNSGCVGGNCGTGNSHTGFKLNFFQHKSGCSNGLCGTTVAEPASPSCTLCGTHAQKPAETSATMLLTGGLARTPNQ
ncbi:MAG: hypothetical protein ACRCZF_13180 [Gemmataceae bacterium]